MTLKAFAHLPATGVDTYSDIESCRCEGGVLVVVLACARDDNSLVKGISLKFPDVTGFRLLDELDLARYWLSNDFARGSYLLEVSDGGWAAEENELQGYESPRREWLVVTGNACMSVFSTAEPGVSPLSWQLDEILNRGVLAPEDTELITAHIPLPLAGKVDRLTSRLERSRDWMVNQALNAWVDQQEERGRLTREAIADVDAGRVIDHQAVQAWADSLGTAHPLRAPVIQPV